MNKVIVLFEVIIKKDCTDDYLKMAAALKDELLKAEGFISSERFSSLVTDGKLLSMSIWESEEAVMKWRNQANHRQSQMNGRTNVFESYKITVTSLCREYSGQDRQNAPKDSNSYLGL